MVLETKAAPSRTRTVRTYCAECGARCGVLATVEDGELIEVIPDREHPNKGFCIKGRAGPEKVANSGRILYPMKRTRPKTDPDPGWERISWDEALDIATENLSKIRRESGPEAVAFTRPAVSGSGSVDWAHWIIRLSRVFGSPNFVSTTHICQWARDNGSAYTYGTGLPKPDYEHARTIVVWGNNPAVTEVQNWLRIRDARRRGAQVIVIDPRLTETASGADLWLAVRPGTDIALALGIVRYILEHNLYDAEFVTHWTNGPFLVDRGTGRFVRPADAGVAGGPEDFLVWDEVSGSIKAVDTRLALADAGIEPRLFVDTELQVGGRPVSVASSMQLLWEAVSGYDLESVEAKTGIASEQVAQAARMIATGPVAYYTHNGVEQHVNTMQTNRALCILFSLMGNYDAQGGNVLNPGAPSPHVDGADLLPRETQSRRLGMEVRPLGAPRQSTQAYTFYEGVLEGKPYKMRGLVAFGGNMLIQNGDTLRGREALQALDFYVHADMFPSPTSQFADILLPAATCWESPGLATGFGGSFETSQYVQYRKPLVQPRGEARSDTEIIFTLAQRLGHGDAFWDGDYVKAYEYQLSATGLKLADLESGEPMQVEAPVAFRKYARKDADGHVAGFRTPSRRIEVYSQVFLDSGLPPLPVMDEPAWERHQRRFGREKYPFILTTAKVSSYVHSSGRGIPMLRRQHPEPFIEVHPETADAAGVRDHDLADVLTPHGQVRVRVHVTDKVIPGVVVTQTGWWEACEEMELPALDPFGPTGANLNFAVTNEIIDEISGSVPGKSYSCNLQPVAQ